MNWESDSILFGSLQVARLVVEARRVARQLHERSYPSRLRWHLTYLYSSVGCTIRQQRDPSVVRPVLLLLFDFCGALALTARGPARRRRSTPHVCVYNHTQQLNATGTLSTAGIDRELSD